MYFMHKMQQASLLADLVMTATVINTTYSAQ